MISKPDDWDLVDHEEYRGAMLTYRGEELARRFGWRFRVVSTFFASELDTVLDEKTAFDIAFVLPRDGVFDLQELASSPCLDLCPGSDSGLDRCATSM